MDEQEFHSRADSLAADIERMIVWNRHYLDSFNIPERGIKENIGNVYQ